MQYYTFTAKHKVKVGAQIKRLTFRWARLGRWLIYIDGDRFRYGIEFGFQTQWLCCAMQNMFTLHKLGTQIPTSYFA